MAWFIVKQPNGLYGRFSDTVDNFTHMNLTAMGAYDVCLGDCGRRDAITKMRCADEDVICEDYRERDGLRRWRACLETIECRNAGDLQNTIDAGSMPPEDLLGII